MKKHLGSLAAGVATLALAAAPVHATTLLFDFGNLGQTTPDVGWNNVTYPSPNPPPIVSPVVDSTGAVVPGVTLEVTDQFFINGQPSQLGSESPSGDAGVYPVSATDDYFFGHTGPFAGGPDASTAAFKLTGLDQSLAYDFTFFSARNGVGDLRETAYTVIGANSAGGLLEAANNDSEVLVLAGIVPDGNNEILVEVEAGPNNSNGLEFYYVNLMQVTTIPEPHTVGMLLVGSTVLAARRRS
ncbi:MAG: hypothetical protein AAFV43_03025 [Planctomycetota bacterium]